MGSKIKRIAIGVALILFCLIFDTVSADSVYVDNSNYEDRNNEIAKDVETYHIPGMAVIVVDKENVLFSATYGNCDSVDTPFIIGSMSKSFTALSIMQLVEEGLVDLDAPISDYIDVSEWFIDARDGDKIKMRDLLHQTSGITTYQTFGKLSSTGLYGSHIYANANYGLLGLIIEEVSGLSYEEYLTRNIFEPLGMKHSAASLEKSKENGLIDGYRNYFGVPVAGEPDYPGSVERGSWTTVSAGYLSSSASDIGKYLQMYLNGGETIISKKSIDRMFYDNVPVDHGEYHYGMGWMYSTKTYRQPMLWHAGLVENYTSNMFILPEKGIAVAVFVNMNDYFVCNNLIGNVINPILGEEKQNLPNLYLILHLLINVICLLLSVISIHSVLHIRTWKKKRVKTFVYDIVRHLIIPAIFLCIPLIMGTPVKVVWLFVKDLFVVIYLNIVILISIGLYKLFFVFRTEYYKRIGEP